MAITRRAFTAGFAAAAAAGRAGAQAPRTALNVAVPAQNIGRLDPAYATSVVDLNPVAWMFNALVRFRPGSMNPETFEPDLAERWESAPDGRTWTFHLRRGVKFHGDYGELSASDVVFSLQRAADPQRSGFAGDYAAIDAVTAVDDYTVRITLKENVPSLLGLVANYHGGLIVSKRAVEERGERFATQPIGTGPFAFAQLQARQSLELVAHPQYFRGRPKLERITYRIIESIAARDLAFASGEIDAVYGPQDQAWVDRMRRQAEATVDVFEPGELSSLYINITRPPFDNIKVRQAIAHAINREQIARFKGQDVARAAQSCIPIGYLGFSSDVPLASFDPDRSRALLREAGLPNGFTVRIVHTTSPNMFTTIQVVQAQLRRVGIVLDIELVEHATFHAQIRRDLSPIVHYGAGRFPVADAYLTQFFHSRSIVGTPTAITNFCHTDIADAEIDAARRATGANEQRRLWATAQRKLLEQVCVVPMFEGLQVWARRASLDYGAPLEGSLSLGPMITEATQFR
jgi:peptide/nickel transport system substrate-binding protein